MQAIEFSSVEMQMLWWSVVLGLAQIAVVASLATRDRGLAYNAGPRDEPGPPVSRLTGRLNRALKNFLETFVFFVVAILMVTSLHRTTPTSELGAHLYFWGRVAYVPAYAAGIPYLRTVIWAVATTGLALVLLTVWPGV
jgi:uncharacterized MAPEG superfamily protein